MRYYFERSYIYGGVLTIDPAFEIKAANYAKKVGFTKKIGAGAMARVFIKPGDTSQVLKCYKFDHGYSVFLAHCRKAKTNKHLPNIIGKTVRVGKRMYAVRLQRLKPLPPNLRKLLAAGNLGWGNAIIGLALSKTMPDNYNPDILGRAREFRAYLRKTKQLESLTRTVLGLQKLATPLFRFDLNPGNLMMNTQDKLVIVDPFAKQVFQIGVEK
jgi:hypothetical protein